MPSSTRLLLSTPEAAVRGCCTCKECRDGSVHYATGGLGRAGEPPERCAAARGNAVRFRVCIDGKPPGAAHGLDVGAHGNGTVASQRFYQLIRQPKPIADQQFAIVFLDAGVEAFAFTFG